jgi:hypothetical protein
MGPPLSAPGKSLGNISSSTLGGTLGGGRHSLDTKSTQPEDEEFVLEDAEDFNSPVKAPVTKSVDIRPANGGSSPTQAKSTGGGDDDDVDFGAGLGGQSAQSRARVMLCYWYHMGGGYCSLSIFMLCYLFYDLKGVGSTARAPDETSSAGHVW